MQIEKLKLIHYRNYEDIQISFNQGINVFVGDNAQGKTNLIEAIYFATYLKSFRQSNEKVLIQNDAAKSYVATLFQTEKGKIKSEIILFENQKKRIKLNGFEIDKKQDYMGRAHAVIFSPDDMKMLKEGPSERRNFLDEMLIKFYPVYQHYYKRYYRLLYQRNMLLKKMRGFKEETDTLNAFDFQMASYAYEIYQRRRAFIQEIKVYFEQIYRNICDEKESSEMIYCSSFGEIEKKEDILNQYLKSRKEDILRKQTGIGPHRDDIEFFIDKKNTKKYASQGQIRSVALSLRLSEIFLVKERYSEFPILLLDDVLSELDEKRRFHLIHYFKDIQTLITTTDRYHLKGLNIHQFFEIKQGSIQNSC